MKRREFVALLGIVLTAWPFTTMAEELPRVGVLVPTDRATAELNLEAFRKGLREIGYAEGQNLIVEYRFAEERDDQLAAELVHLNVKIIVTWGTPAGFAAKNATSTIPIVMATAGDPVGTGLVSSLARPGGNITGQSSIAPDMGEKTLGLLRKVAPGAYRIAILLNPTNPFSVPTLKQVKVAAYVICARLQAVDVRYPEELESAFSAMAAEGAEALIVVNDLVCLPNAKRIAALAVKSRLPTIFIRREYVAFAWANKMLV